MTGPPVRGQIYRADLGYGPKPWLVVSNNGRNRHTRDVLAVRLTTTERQLPTWTELGADDPLGGRVNCDNIERLARDELADYLGTLTPTTMTAVNRALGTALPLEDTP